MIIIVFGLAGVGKDFVGERIAKYLKVPYFNGDLFLTPSMKELIARKVPFTQEVRDEFVGKFISNVRSISHQGHKHVVIGQGLYKEVNRQGIKTQIDNILFVNVVAPENVIMERLKRRSDHIDLSYAKVLGEGFESMKDCIVIDNGVEGEVEVQSQIEQYFNRY